MAAERAGGLLTAESYERAYQAAVAALEGVEHVPSSRPTAALLHREFQLVGRMLRHAARRGQLALGQPVLDRAALRQDLGEIIDEHCSLWLARSRPGGLKDSVARLQKAMEDY
jgi:hexosaminidase